MKPRITLLPLAATFIIIGFAAASSSILDRPLACPRGGGERFDDSSTTEQQKNHHESTSNNNSNITIEEYVQAMKERDEQESHAAAPHADADGTTGGSNDEEQEDPASVGVKSHQHHQHHSIPSSTSSASNAKKSNAVGDPDGDDDDDDESESDMTEYSEEWMEEEIDGETTTYFEVEPQLQVEVELVEEGGEESMLDVEDDEDDEESSSFKASGGGVGVRLGRPRRNNNNNKSRGGSSWRGSSAASSKQLSHDQTRLLQAWLPHVHFPPTPTALSYLDSNARLLDASSKSRLDRRTLYAGLLQEWGFGSKFSSSSSSAKRTASSLRKFLPVQTSQALQAALSMATQPQWRSSSPSINGIRLYQDEESGKVATLGMQETIAMALAHSLGCGMLILDDNIINSVRQELAKHGFPEEALKPAALVQSLLDMAQKGKLRPAVKAGSISECMKRDLNLGLDDPFDERATISCDDMIKWEEEWHKGIKDVDKDNVPLPLVVFLRTSTSNALLKSKSAMELLLRECGSEDSIHLVTLGKGIDATTIALPKETSSSRQMTEAPEANRRPAQSPWHGFSQQNQNASGQNDPPGSRRFNIFLARTLDHNKQPGILGAIAPPQAGNLFPQMMAMHAQARIEQKGDEESSMDKLELEQWRALSQKNQMEMIENHGDTPVANPQFFNASLAITPFSEEDNGQMPPSPPPPPEKIHQALQQAMNELLDRLASAADEDDEPMSPEDLSSDVQKAFAQVLQNQNLRRGIAENLSRAAPALSDPKCQGVMLSVYVPPPMHHPNRLNMSGPPDDRQQNNMGGWFQKILNNQDENSEEPPGEESAAQKKQKRIRTLAAAAAVQAANKSKQSKDGDNKSSENKAERNLARLEQVCRPIAVGTPQDPVRAKSWESWIDRERGAIIFKQNRRVLNAELASRKLALQQHTGTRGAGSALRQMLSVRDLAFEMEDVIKCAVELEAAKSLRQHETSTEMHEKEESLEIDISLSQLMLAEDGSVVESTEEAITLHGTKTKKEQSETQYIHPSSLEAALSMRSRISPSPAGGLSVSGQAASHRSREEIASLAQDKHERALVSQVVSPQDIGVTYDMIGGLSEVKELLRQSITYPLKFPHLYSEGIAREAVKGVLLFGPPGTGKTMLAKAVATEGGASFLSVDASSVENKWLGESEKNAKAVFTLARRLAPCVIFIDEVDSLLSSREGSSDDSAHGTLTSVKTTMMSEWDGLSSGTNGVGEAGSDRVVVIGSTNRPFDLDEAVLRRFPRRILVDLPDLETRKEILEVTLAENRMDPAVNLTLIAERLEGYTGSDIKEVCREAVVQISHEQARLLDQGFVNSREDVTEGSLQRLRPVTAEDFEQALSKLKKSVSEKGRELMRVWEWNDEYGEIKKEKTNRLPHLMNMYL